MHGLLRFLLAQGVLLNITFVGLLLAGVVVAIPSLPIDRYPAISFGEVAISTVFPGATPEEVERLVTEPIEDSLRGMPDVEFVRSVSRAGLSTMNVKFEDDSDYAGLYEELRLRVLAVQGRLPVVDGKPLQPRFIEITVDEWLPVIQVNLIAADPQTPVAKRDLVLLGRDLRSRLEQIDRVKEVQLLGEEVEQFVVALDPARLERLAVTPAQVAAALQATGGSPPAGSMSGALGERLIRVDGRFRDHDAVLATVVRADGGAFVRVRDLIDEAETGVRRMEGAIIATVNGRDTVTCKVLKHRRGNALRIVAAVEREVATFLEAHREQGITAVMTMDSTNEIRDGLGTLVESLLLSAVLVMLVLFVFLADRSRRVLLLGIALGGGAALAVALRAHPAMDALAIGGMAAFIFATCRTSILTVSGIVFSFIGALLYFHLAGYSINEITLLGFVLVSGIVVDDAIIVLENIQRHRERGAPLHQAVVDGAAEVAWPVISATLSTCAAFLPMLLMTGAVGEFFALVPITVAVALAISLIECLIFLPLHVIDLERILGPERRRRPMEELADPLARRDFLGVLARGYHGLLGFNLRHRRGVLLAVGGLCLLAFGTLAWSFVAPRHGMRPPLTLKFFPDDTTVLNAFVRMPPTATLGDSDDIVRTLARDLIAEGPSRVAAVTGLAGMMVDESYRPMRGNQYGFLNIELPRRDARCFDDLGDFINGLRDHLQERHQRDGVEIELRAQQGGPPTGPALAVRLAGRNDEELLDAAESLLGFLRQEAEPGGRLDGLIQLRHDRQHWLGVLDFTVDAERVALLGLDPARVRHFVAGALDGQYAGDFRRSDGDIPLRVRLSPRALAEPEALRDLPLLANAQGDLLRFADLGALHAEAVPDTLVRRDHVRTITVTGMLRDGISLGAQHITGIAREWASAQVETFPGVSVAFGGESESTMRSYRSLGFAFLFAVVLIYAILAAQFNSYGQPLLIMSNIVFGFCGVILTMATFGTLAQVLGPGVVRPERAWFTVDSFIAIIGLSGLVVNDAIVLIDFINRRRRLGMPLHEAVMSAGLDRMRPILMTTLTTIAGLLPMAIGIPAFSIAWGPFATAFIAGLCVATVMTLLVVPVFYAMVARPDPLVEAAPAPSPERST